MEDSNKQSEPGASNSLEDAIWETCTTSPETQELLDRVGHGDESEFEQLVKRFDPWLRRYIHLRYRGLDNAYDQDDVLSTVLRRVVRSRSSFGGMDREKWRAWLRRVVENALFDLARRRLAARRQGNEVPLADLDFEPNGRSETPSVILGREEDREVLLAAIATLEPEQAKVLHLYYFEELSVAEIASKLDLDSENEQQRHETAKKRIQRARKALELKLDRPLEP